MRGYSKGQREASMTNSVGAFNLASIDLNPFLDMIAMLVVEKLKTSDLDNQQHTNKVIEIPKNNPDEPLKRDEVCDILKISLSTLYNLKSADKLIPDYYIGRSPRYKRSSIENYLNNNKVE